MSVATAHSASAVPPADETPATSGAPTRDEGFWVEPGAAEAQTPEAVTEAVTEAVAEAVPAAEVPAQSSREPAPAQPTTDGAAPEPSGLDTPAQAHEDDTSGDAVDEQVARDAREFGVYARTGGWAFALKVARSVRPGGETPGETAKVSAKRFAELAGCSPERVMRYYKAWDKAADDGMVPHFEALAPGEEIDLPDSDVWLSYYSSRSSATSDRGTAIAAAAEAEGIRPTKALEVAENPTALRAAILADLSTAQAARAALLDRLKEDPSLQTELARDIARTDELKKAVASETQAASRIGYVRQIVENGQVKTPAGQVIDATAELRAEAERHLSLIDELDDDEDTGEWATEAYDTVKELVVQTVQSDPELRVQERRTKFYSSLQKATKVFEELTLDDAVDLDAIYEEDMLERLEELQQALSTCIAALRKASPDE
ncbi:hypothetical protein PV755_17790 [Streptomyces caniscabiei]|uniref:Uncharacterized protein n=1 Tax=Streptomyces caniscabiei TaxID=2746961 RepID=A0A927L385_9ACTN|nr:hypothetical protein [Streptomyces caniscabiei]MBD9725225.1 hypothetical protein [Streptomyces caniscabiei]MDX3510775.1 hypothetical protein [Streptomyces caniscabiei]MDX3720282.1 hypothetical protein [Streptomyces caniscabiei]WEO29382.1 hypothetical protein IHE65_42880 [Streptomyces caniscabiei]